VLNLLLDSKNHNPWSRQFEDNLMDGFKMLNYPYKTISIDCLYKKSFTSKDWLFIMNYEDLEVVKELGIEAKLIMHSHGTSYNPYAYNVGTYEREQLKQVDLVTTLSMSHQLLLKDKTNRAEYIGFPLQLEILWNCYNKLHKEKKIVIGGRISPDKQFYLATYLLQPLLNKYKIVFSISANDSREWVNFYDLTRFEELGFIFHYNTQEEFYQELGNAKFFFTCSLGDTICLSLVEAQACGCYLLYPNITNGYPVWRDYLSGGYEPFSQESIFKFIKEMPNYEVDYSLFDSKQVCERLIKLLQ